MRWMLLSFMSSVMHSMNKIKRGKTLQLKTLQTEWKSLKLISFDENWTWVRKTQTKLIDDVFKVFMSSLKLFEGKYLRVKLI